jgi:branched-chain amino acid transport system substrate-binding protein
MRARLTGTLLVTVALGVSACGSPSNGPAQTNKGPTDKQLIIGMINPFSGINAAYGLDMNAGCLSAVNIINAKGGVLGHTFKCIPIDSKGDAADAVPAVTRALAQYSNMVGVVGPGTDAATATMPLLEQARIPTIGANGDVSFDQNAYKYYWRITPSDAANAVAIVVAAQNLHYVKAALVFGNDAPAQTSVPVMQSAWPKAGGQIVANVSLTPSQPSYQTEAAKVAASNPDVIFTETDPQTAATFFGELKQMGHLVPIFGTDPTITPSWYTAVSGAMGKQNLQTYYRGVLQYVPPSGVAVTTFNNSLLAETGVANPGQYSGDPFTKSYYDSVNMLVLAMLKAGTVNPPDYNASIEAVTTGSTIVNDFADGAQALAQGKSITYSGAVGAISFDKYHNSFGSFAVVSFGPDGNPSSPLTVVTAEQLKPFA